MTLSHRSILTLSFLTSLAVSASACSFGTPCERVSKHVLEIALATPATASKFSNDEAKDRWVKAKTEECEKKQTSDTTIECYLAANSLEELGKCEKLADDPTCVADCNCSTKTGCPEGMADHLALAAAFAAAAVERRGRPGAATRPLTLSRTLGFLRQLGSRER